MIPRSVLFALAVTGVLGCSSGPPRVSLSPPRKAPPQQDFEKMRARWTRSARIIKKLDTTLRVHATCFSPEFSAAFLARRVHEFKLSPGQRRQEAQKLDEQWSKSYVFLVVAATINYDWNDFDRTKSVWHIAVVNDGGEQVNATEITNESIDATLKSFFPFIGPFHRAYTLRFPKVLPDGRPLVTADTKSLALRFAGTLGQAELVWRLR